MYELIQQARYHRHQSSSDILRSEQFDLDVLMSARMVATRFRTFVHKCLTLECLLLYTLLFDSQYTVHHQSLMCPPYIVLEMYIP